MVVAGGYLPYFLLFVQLSLCVFVAAPHQSLFSDSFPPGGGEAYPSLSLPLGGKVLSVSEADEGRSAFLIS